MALIRTSTVLRIWFLRTSESRAPTDCVSGFQNAADGWLPMNPLKSLHFHSSSLFYKLSRTSANTPRMPLIAPRSRSFLRSGQCSISIFPLKQLVPHLLISMIRSSIKARWADSLTSARCPQSAVRVVINRRGEVKLSNSTSVTTVY